MSGNIIIETPEGEKVPGKSLRKQGGLKKDILDLVFKMPFPDRACERTDFLMALQHVLDRHLEGEQPEKQEITTGFSIMAIIDGKLNGDHGEEDIVKRFYGGKLPGTKVITILSTHIYQEHEPTS